MVLEKKRAENRRVVPEGEHLIRKELHEMEESQMLAVEANKDVGQVVGRERLRAKTKERLLLGGGMQVEMDID